MFGVLLISSSGKYIGRPCPLSLPLIDSSRPFSLRNLVSGPKRKQPRPKGPESKRLLIGIDKSYESRYPPNRRSIPLICTMFFLVPHGVCLRSVGQQKTLVHLPNGPPACLGVMDHKKLLPWLNKINHSPSPLVRIIHILRSANTWPLTGYQSTLLRRQFAWD